jgi:hypothetical protein
MIQYDINRKSTGIAMADKAYSILSWELTLLSVRFRTVGLKAPT